MTGDLYGTRVLQPRENKIIELVASGLRNKDVAAELKCTEGLIKNYLKAIFDKLGVFSRLELALWYEAHRS